MSEKNEKNQKSGSIHRDHRKRMRERMIRHGVENFADHELLEVALYSANARGDTNELAHMLLEHFGSLDVLMEARAEDLTDIDGMGEAGAALIVCIGELMRRYIRTLSKERQRYSSVQDLARYAWGYLCGLDHERLYMILLDNQLSLIDMVLLADGTVTSAEVRMSLILDKVTRKKAAFVALAHNHPHGTANPSDKDIELTNSVSELLNIFGVSLIEHIVIAEDRYWPIIKHRRSYPPFYETSKVLRAKNFDADSFYDVDDDSYRFSSVLEKP